MPASDVGPPHGLPDSPKTIRAIQDGNPTVSALFVVIQHPGAPVRATPIEVVAELTAISNYSISIT